MKGAPLLNPLTPAGIRTRREGLGLSRRELAEILDVAEASIRSWETGKTMEPYWSQLLPLSTYRVAVAQAALILQSSDIPTYIVGVED